MLKRSYFYVTSKLKKGNIESEFSSNHYVYRLGRDGGNIVCFNDKIKT